MAKSAHIDDMHTLEHPSPSLRRNAKDGVFCDLFSRKEYLIELYRDLHPEDKSTTEEDLEIVTMERVITNGPYNDLGFVANGRLVVLVEAQSTWSPNIATRMLLYLAETYRGVVQESGVPLYDKKIVELPTPELYVVYTGPYEVPAQISFKHDVLKNDNAEFDFTIRVITKSDGIVGQYAEFARKFDEVAKSNGDPKRKAKTLLDGCIDRGILKKYLKSRYKEVGDIMFTLFDQEEQARIYDKYLRESIKAEFLAEGIAEGRAEGVAQGRAEGIAAGREEGIAQGREEGIAQGRAKGFAESVKAVIENMSMSADEAMSLLKVPADLRDEVAKRIAE